MTTAVTSLSDAIDLFSATLTAHPERDIHAAHEAVLAGRPRQYPVLYLNHLSDPEDCGIPEDDYVPPDVRMPDSMEGHLTHEIIGMLNPLSMDNPIAPTFGLGKGPGTLVTAFNIPLDPEAGNSPAYSRPLDAVLADGHPDPATAGLMPEMLQRIDRIKDHVAPGTFKIGLPDFQGPFNLAHAVLGEDALTAPYLEPDKFHRLMDMITTYWIEARALMIGHIGRDWLTPMDRTPLICECSVNLISPDMYAQHILPHDLHIMEHYGAVRIHPCSGPHVVQATLEGLPGLIYTEAGLIAKTAAGSQSAADALARLGGRPVILAIGQEPPKDGEFESIRDDLALYPEHHRMLFSYTGMHWRIADRPRIRALHGSLDEWWEENIRPKLSL